MSHISCPLVIGWSIWRTYKAENTLNEVMIETAKQHLWFLLFHNAAMLTAAFRGFGGEHYVKEFLQGLPGGFWTQFIVDGSNISSRASLTSLKLLSLLFQSLPPYC